MLLFELLRTMLRYERFRLKFMLYRYFYGKKRSYPLSSGSENVIVIHSSGRSGSTLLARILQERYNIFFPPENYHFHLAALKFVKLSAQPWEKIAAEIYKIICMQEDIERFRLVCYDDYQYHANRLKEKSFLSLMVLYYRLSCQYGKQDELMRLGLKIPALSFHQFLYRYILKNASIIYLIRDPRSVLNSHVNAKFVSENFSSKRYESEWIYLNLKSLVLKRRVSIDYQDLTSQKYHEILDCCFTRTNGPVFDNGDLELTHMSNVSKSVKDRQSISSNNNCSNFTTSIYAFIKKYGKQR